MTNFCPNPTLPQLSSSPSSDIRLPNNGDDDSRGSVGFGQKIDAVDKPRII